VFTRQGGCVLAVLCPGQGAQTPGFLTPWLDVTGFGEQLDAWSAYAGFDLVRTGTAQDVDVVDTAVAQPLLVAAGLATATLIGPLPAATVLVGHSVGEITAAAVTGAYDVDAAMSFARERGRAMASAGELQQSGMTAILGGDADEVAAAIASAGCWIANHNAAGQVVAGGTTDNLARLADAAPAGARLRPLQVAGAFHTPLMQPAQDALTAAGIGVPTGRLQHPIVSNADGHEVITPGELHDRLIAQITAPVRFDRCVDTLKALGVTAAVELAPGGVLTAIIRRALPDVSTVALRTPDELAEARLLISSFTEDVGDVLAVGWRLVVAPASGTLQRGDTLDGDAVYPAEQLALVTQRSGTVSVASPVTGELVEWLVEDGDPVHEGQPVARITPAAR
jgi:[acyl-carrier-protein] S-malonyltransferase